MVDDKKYILIVVNWIYANQFVATLHQNQVLR